MTFNKADVVNAVRNQLDLPKHRAVELVESLLEIIKKTLQNGEDVLISGFGKFCVKRKWERRGRNPQTGEDMMLDERRVVVFKSSRLLRDNINRSG